MRFVVDTSALLAVRQDEPEREAFHRLLLTGSPHGRAGVHLHE